MTENSDFETVLTRVRDFIDLDGGSPEESLRSPHRASNDAFYDESTKPVSNTGPSESVFPQESLATLRLDGSADASYEIQETLGMGGMGKVELAVQRSLGREVAVKTARNENSKAAALALFKEARISGLLDHPNIIPIHDLGIDPRGAPVIVMKRVLGDSWRDLARNEAHPRWKEWARKPFLRNLEILRDVCNAVHFAHSRGVLHRDIKTDNVMIGAFGEVYLVDWGLALPLKDRDPENKRLVGTPAYLAPEMLDGESRVSERSDIYLLGATLHELLTKQAPHQGSPYKALNAAFHSKPQDYDESVPKELVKLCHWSMKLDPDKRPQSALEFRQALENYLDHYGSIELSEGALDKLRQFEDALTNDCDEKALLLIFAECRFAFEQALRIWPENQQAREGLQKCLELMIERELPRRNKGLVATLVAALPEPRAELEAKLQYLEQRLSDEQSNQERLRDLERDHDLRVSGRFRSRFVMVAAVLAGASVFVLRIFQDQFELSFTTDVLLMIPLGIGLCLAFYLGRNALFRTTVNRRIAYSAVIGFGMVLLNRFMGQSLGSTMRATMAYDGVIMTSILLMMGNAIDSRLYWIVPVALLSTVLSGLWPEYLFEFSGIGGSIAYLMLAAIWASDENSEEKEEKLQRDS
ncbi:MAG: serine/threonine-protein kinase [Planctomycetota bacterium]|nr:serine/threonine-protein kinase [Planctomycetota bacterium]